MNKHLDRDYKSLYLKRGQQLKKIQENYKDNSMGEILSLLNKGYEIEYRGGDKQVEIFSDIPSYITAVYEKGYNSYGFEHIPIFKKGDVVSLFDVLYIVGDITGYGYKKKYKMISETYGSQYMLMKDQYLYTLEENK